MAWVTRPERPKGVKVVVKQAGRAHSRPLPRSRVPEGAPRHLVLYISQNNHYFQKMHIFILKYLVWSISHQLIQITGGIFRNGRTEEELRILVGLHE